MAAISCSSVMGTNGKSTGADGDVVGAPDCTSAIVVDGGKVASGWEMGGGMVVGSWKEVSGVPDIVPKIFDTRLIGQRVLPARVRRL